jgi:hypothetical protein
MRTVDAAEINADLMQEMQGQMFGGGAASVASVATQQGGGMPLGHVTYGKENGKPYFAIRYDKADKAKGVEKLTRFVIEDLKVKDFSRAGALIKAWRPRENGNTGLARVRVNVSPELEAKMRKWSTNNLILCAINQIEKGEKGNASIMLVVTAKLVWEEKMKNKTSSLAMAMDAFAGM